MRYLLALLVPPAALLACGRVWQAGIVLAFWLAGLATLGWGLGILLVGGSMLWAIHAVGDYRAALDAAQFIRHVRPIPTVRE